jgi:hypothetical protein
MRSQDSKTHRKVANTLPITFSLAKTGQFVTIWKRSKEGITQPFEISDDIDLYIIATRRHDQLGIFIFPKMVLYHQKVLAGMGGKGKRGMRVYAPWDMVGNQQAARTQEWQTVYFLDIAEDGAVDLDRARLLLGAII